MSKTSSVLEKNSPVTVAPAKFWIRQHRQSHFAPAFLFLSRERRLALERLYAVCRLLDDIVDTKVDNPELYLNAWREVFTSRSAHPVKELGHLDLAQEFLEAADHFQIPMSALLDLINKGVMLDLKEAPIETGMDLEAYCYGVAGTVGLACLPIFGVPIEEGKNYAIRLGIAVQWVNTLRDVGTDAKMGRVYLPLDHLSQFGYTREDILNSQFSPDFIRLMEFEDRIAESHFRRAEELLPHQWKAQLRPAQIMGDIYRRLLRKVRKAQYPVLHRKIRLNLIEKGWATIGALKQSYGINLLEKQP